MNAGSAEVQGRNKGEGTKPAWSSEIRSIESVVIDGRWRIVYTGPSMNPTLSEPDMLWVEPYGLRQVRVGDVVCFRLPEQDINIVHRVVSVGPRSTVCGCGARGTQDRGSTDRILTRGDNNLWPDTGVLTKNDLMGRVVSAQRGPRLRSIPGGYAGRMIACSVRLRKAVWRAVPGVGSGVYQRLVRSGPLGLLVPGGLRPRPVYFNGRGAPTLKLLMGSRTVGLYDYSINQWNIRRLFRPFVDEQTLPELRPEARSSEPNVPSPESKARQ